MMQNEHAHHCRRRDVHLAHDPNMIRTTMLDNTNTVRRLQYE